MLIITIIVLGIVFAIIDAAWLKLTRGFYQKEIGKLLLKKPNMIAAVIFYVIYTIGVALLVVEPAIEGHWQLGELLARAALVGGLSYATYDLTNLATIKGWSARVVVIDIIWGIFVTSAASAVTYGIMNWLFV